MSSPHQNKNTPYTRSRSKSHSTSDRFSEKHHSNDRSSSSENYKNRRYKNQNRSKRQHSQSSIRNETSESRSRSRSLRKHSVSSSHESDSEIENKSYSDYENQFHSGKILKFKEFLSGQNDNISPEEALKNYKQYQKEYQFSRTQIFFDRHKDEEWFREKYNPIFLSKKRRKQIKLAQNEAKTFIQMFRDKKLNFDDDLNGFKASNSPELKDKNDVENMETIVEREYIVISDNETEENEKKAIFSSHFLHQNAGNKLFCYENTVFIKAIPLRCTRNQLTKFFSQIEGFEKLFLSEPIPRLRNHRYGWVVYKEQSQALAALKLSGTTVKYHPDFQPFFLHILPKIKSRKQKISAPSYSLNPKRITKDLELAQKLAKHLNAEKKINDDFFEEILSDLHENELKQLNMFIKFLRQIHYFCYYCGREFMDEEELLARCGKFHPRRKDKNEEFDIDSWEKDLENRIENRLEKYIKNLDADWEADALHHILESKTSSSAERVNFFCRICRKAFCSPGFVHKHIKNFHPKKLMAYLKIYEEKDFFYNYKNDPDKLTLGDYEPIFPGGNIPMDKVQSSTKAYYYKNRNNNNNNQYRRNFPQKRMNEPMKSPQYQQKKRAYTDYDKPTREKDKEIDYGFDEEIES